MRLRALHLRRYVLEIYYYIDVDVVVKRVQAKSKR